jgi:hypothetical protein
VKIFTEAIVHVVGVKGKPEYKELRDVFLSGWKKGGAFLMALAVAACGSDPVDVGGDGLTVKQLYGTWNWVSSEGGIAGGVRTPETEGFVQQVILSDPLQIELIVDGVSIASTTFTFSSADLDGGETRSRMTLAQPLPGFGTQFVEIDTNGDLLLADPCCDGFVHRFTPS